MLTCCVLCLFMVVVVYWQWCWPVRCFRLIVFAGLGFGVAVGCLLFMVAFWLGVCYDVAF